MILGIYSFLRYNLRCYELFKNPSILEIYTEKFTGEKNDFWGLLKGTGRGQD